WEIKYLETVELVQVASQKCEPDSWRGEHEVVAFSRYFIGESFIASCRLVVSGVRGSECGQSRDRTFRIQGVATLAFTAASVRSVSSTIRFHPPHASSTSSCTAMPWTRW